MRDAEDRMQYELLLQLQMDADRSLTQSKSKEFVCRKVLCSHENCCCVTCNGIWPGWRGRKIAHTKVHFCGGLTMCVLMEFNWPTVQSTSGSGNPVPLQLTVTLSPSLTRTLLWLTLISGKSGGTQTHLSPLPSEDLPGEGLHPIFNQIRTKGDICTPTSPPGDKTSEPSDSVWITSHLIRFTPELLHISSSSNLLDKLLLLKLILPWAPAEPAQPLPYRISRCTCFPGVSWRLRLCSTAPACGASPLLSAATAGSSECRIRSRKPLHPNVCKHNSEETKVRSWRRGVPTSNKTQNQQICFLKLEATEANYDPLPVHVHRMQKSSQAQKHFMFKTLTIMCCWLC